MKSSENYFCRKNCIKAIERKTKLVCFLGHSHFLSIVHKFSLSHTNDFWNFKMFIKKIEKLYLKKKKKSVVYTIQPAIKCTGRNELGGDLVHVTT